MESEGNVAVMGESAREGERHEGRLREAVRKARLAEAERADVIVHLRAMETTRLEDLREAVADVFAEIPQDMAQFDLALQRASEPRLWIDMIAFVVMGRDKETYRFLQDTQNGRRVLFEGRDVQAAAERITDYVALRIVEREKALAGHAEVPPAPDAAPAPQPAAAASESTGGLGWFVAGLLAGVIGLFAIGWIVTMPG